MVRLIAELNKDSLSGWFHSFADLNFLYFAILLFLICIVLMIIVSLLTQAPTYEKIQGLTYGTTVLADKKKSRASWNYKDVILSVIIILILALTLIYFSPLFFG